MEFHMINVIYVVLPMRAQTKKMTLLNIFHSSGYNIGMNRAGILVWASTRGITHARTNIKDDIFSDKDEAHTLLNIFRSSGNNIGMNRAATSAWASALHGSWHFFFFFLVWGIGTQPCLAGCRFRGSWVRYHHKTSTPRWQTHLWRRL